MLTVAMFAVFGIASAATVLVLVDPAPLHEESAATSQTSVGRPDHPFIPDLLAGHIGWCTYGPSRTSGGACAAAGAPLRSAPVEKGHGMCGFQPLHVADLAAHWGQVITEAPPAPSRQIANGALLSCASNWYSIDGEVLLASILLNAHDVRERAPTIPGFVALGGQTGVFAAPSSDLAARRFGRGWLAVRGGTPALRALLLDRLGIHIAPSR